MNIRNICIQTQQRSYVSTERSSSVTTFGRKKKVTVITNVANQCGIFATSLA
uniref:Uncharacterized protein n=1 Tax=Arion vulgaris TaxID=1028688 RepID=A0A0B7C3W4_9EUPU